MQIVNIRVNDRYRKDLGDIAALADSIADVGLLQPIVTKPDGTLLVGLRRLEACKRLGWTDIPSVIATTATDVLAALKAERDENTCRKPFTPSEAVAIARAIEPLERQAARERYEQTRPGVAEKFTAMEKGRALDHVAETVGMSRPTLLKARAVVDAAEVEPELFGDLVEKMDAKGVDGAYKEAQKRKRGRERRKIAESVAALPEDDRWCVEQADMRTYQPAQRFDFIITDPPYSKEFLPLYEDLARRAGDWLKPGGLVLAMCGQSYLDQIMEMMGRYLSYYWTGCYWMPGQSTPLRQKQVNTNWKPVLIYGLAGQGYTGKIFGDVWRSDGNDKEHHHWGQSESGMYAIISQVCLPGQAIFDPFCGAGTTGIAALRHGCTFTGIDMDAEHVAIARARLAGAL